MIIKLIDNENLDLVTVEIFMRNDLVDLISTVHIIPYSKLVLTQLSEHSENTTDVELLTDLIEIFHNMQSFRFWLWNVHGETEHLGEIKDYILNFMESVRKKFKLKKVSIE